MAAGHLRDRQALFQDALLAPLNLGVSVRDHVATLWGPVPSPDLARRAEERVRQVQGIGEVINQLHVEPPDGPPGDLPRNPPLAQQPPRDEFPVQEQPTPLVGRPEEHGPVSSQLAGGRGQGARKGQVVSGNPPPAEDPSVPVMPSIALPTPSAAGDREPAAAAPPVPPTDPAQAIDRLRQGDERYRRVRPEVDGGTVRLRGTVYCREDLFGLAQAISHLPGVQRVVIENVQTDPLRRPGPSSGQPLAR